MSSRRRLAEEVLVIDLYCRISKDYDGTLRSVEDQEEQGRAWAKENGYVVGAVHRDHALSAWNPKVERPSWNALMARLRSGEANGVWVRDLDRFTRKLKEALELVELAEKGTQVAAGHSTYDLTTARGIRTFQEDAVDAEFESNRISERTRRGKKNKARRGRSNASYRGFARDGFGPKPEGWEPGDPREMVDPAQLRREQEAVRQAVAELLAGGTLHGIATRWNEAELLTVTGKRWDGGLVRQLLTGGSLAGLIEHQGEVVGTMDGEPCLDRATWDQLQAHLKARKRGRPATAYLLSGLLACGKCGGKLYGRPLTARQPYADGEMRRQYWCQPRAKEQEGCGALTIDWRFADAAVEEAVLAVLGDARHADRLARVAVKVQEARHELQVELSRLEEDAKGIASKTAARGLAWVEAAMEPLDARMAELRDKLSELEEPDTTATVDAARAWKDGSLAQRRAMVKRAFPKGIAVLPASSRGKASLTADRFVWGSDRGSDRSQGEGAA